jgi:hypothetical protein
VKGVPGVEGTVLSILTVLPAVLNMKNPSVN